MILGTPDLHPTAVPDEVPVPSLDTVAPRFVRGYNRRVALPELAARRATPRQFKCEASYVLQKRAGPWKKICQEFLPIGFVISPDGRTAALDVILPDGSAVILPAAAIREDGTEQLEQWAAYWLLDCPEPRAVGFWLREAIATLRDVRIDASLRYVEGEEHASLRLIHVAEKALGRPLRGVLVQ